MATNPNDRYPTPQSVMRALLPYLRSQGGDSRYLLTRDQDHESTAAFSRRVITHVPKKNRRVLLVDDDVMMRTIARHALSSEGFECAEAVDGKEALVLVHSQPFDLLLVDVEMPRLRGDDLLHRTLALPNRSRRT